MGYAHRMHSFDTDRLHLRPLGVRDEAFYCSLYTDAVLMRHIATPMSLEAARRSFQTVLKQQGTTRRIWVIVERASRTEHGILGVFPKEEEAEVGVMLSAPAQGRGFAGEVITAVAGDLFQMPAILRLWTRHATANGPAAALMRKLGFEPVAVAQLPSGSPDGESRWQMTRERWTRCREREAVATAGPAQ